MAHFYAEIQGNRGEATRVGTKQSGISGHIRGWNVGVRVSCVFNEKTGKDEVHVRLTSGSGGHKSGKCLGVFTADDLE